MRRLLITMFAVLTFVGVATLSLDVVSSAGFVPVTDQALQNPPRGDWLRWRRDNAATGFSPLDQINRGNVQKLRLAWAWGMERGAQEQEPLVRNGVLYLPHPNNVVQALDGRTGSLIWEYRRKLGNLADDDTVRNIALYQDKVFLATQDANLVALNADTGKVVWDVDVADHTRRVYYSAGPIAADGKVFAGLSCGTGKSGICFLSAHDANTGKELWRRESVAGPRDPQEHQDTWGGVPYERRLKGSFWMAGSYDPDLDLIYWTTASPGPYPEIHRGTGKGAVLYTNSLLALEADTGAIKWFFQMEPRDNFDMDHQDNPILANVDAGGRLRKMVFALGKPGILWGFDRESGQYVWHQQLVAEQNIYERIDRDTGAITMNEAIIPKAVGVKQLTCPGSRGGKLIQSHAYSPVTHALYNSVNNSCATFEIVPMEQRETGLISRIAPMEKAGGKVGRLTAVSATNGEVLWTYDQRVPVGSVLTTGGGLVFAGDFHRYFRAFDDKTGKVLWEVPLSGPVTGYPISYEAGGKQYVAVGVGGGTSGQRDLAQLYPEMVSPTGSNVLMVFALGD
jgi:alcohol dehydrogenase (cytochrome c)